MAGLPRLMTAAANAARRVSLLAPGQAPKTFAAKATGLLPELKWPATPEEAHAALQKLGFTATKQTSRSALYQRGDERLALTHMQLADRAGYTVEGSGAKHVQLGDLSFTGAQWELFHRGYTETLELFNRALSRPAQFATRQAVHAGESALHGPQDGVKRFLRLAAPLEKLTEARQDLQHLGKLDRTILETVAAAKASGKAPKHFAIVVEGNDGASKSGNGQALAKLLEKAGYAVESKAFRAPTEAERAKGVAGRYADFVKPGDKPTVFLLDRGFPGDFVHNPTADVNQVATAVHGLERGLKDQGVQVVKLLFRPGEESPLVTFGKRLARSKVAGDLLRSRAGMSAAEREELKAAAAMQPGYRDFQNVKNSAAVQARYDEFAAKNQAVFPWKIIETADRHAGRVATREYFLSLLKPTSRGWAP